MEPVKKPSSKAIELERLRRELLRRIIANEAQRRATVQVASK